MASRTVSRVSLSACLHEVLQPGIVGAGLYTLSSAEVTDGCVVAEAFKDNANLLLSGKLAAGYSLDVPDELSGLLSPGPSLPD